MKLLPRLLITTIFYLIPCILLLAQPTGGGPNDGGDPGDVPITGIEWLIAGGAALGIRQFIKSKKDQK